MELRQLKYFIAVAEELHFGNAAKRLHVAEQPLSYQIKKLENELGLKLFFRTTRSVALTPAGASLLKDAYEITARSKRAADNARRIASGKAGVVRLGFESATVPSVMPEFVRLFRAEYPEIDLVLVEHSKAGLSALADGVDDACLVTRYERLPRWVEYIPVVKDRAVVALPVDHPLAGKESIHPSDLANGNFLGYQGAGSIPVNQYLAKLAAVSDVELAVTQEAESYMALLGLVAAGFGFTIVTSSMEGFFSGRVVYRPLANPEIVVDYGLAVKEGDEKPTLEPLKSVARHLASGSRRVKSIKSNLS